MLEFNLDSKFKFSIVFTFCQKEGMFNLIKNILV